MPRLRAFLSRIAALSGRSSSGQEFDEELHEHLALLEEKFVHEGMTPDEAAYAARRQFGGITRVKQERYESRGILWIETLLQDVRLAARTLRKSPGFTITVLAALALGIGANTAVFSIFNAALLKPLPAPDPDHVVRLVLSYPGGFVNGASPQEVQLWQRQTSIFDEVSAYRTELMNLTGGPRPEQAVTARVTAGFFRLFGAPIAYGRSFTEDEDRPGGPHVAVLSHALWAQRFAADPRVLGKAILLNGDSYLVVGILGSGFDSEQFDQHPQIWIPFQIDPKSTEGGCYCLVTGHLKPGVTLAMARARFGAVADDYRREFPSKLGKRTTFTILPLRQAMLTGDSVLGDVKSSLLILAVAVGLILLIACANVAGLMLIRGAGRTREIAIRAAAGASRGRIVRQLFTESLILSCAGGAAGLALGIAGIRALLALYSSNPVIGAVDPIHIPRIGRQGAALALDWRVATFAVAISLLTVVLFGLFPALRASRIDLNSALKHGGARSGSERDQNKTRSLLVVGEIAMALILLIGASLLMRTRLALRSVDPGFDRHNVFVMQMSLSGSRYEKTSEIGRVIREGIRGIGALPGVKNVAASCCVPLETVWSLTFDIEGHPNGGGPYGRAGWTFVSPQYFDAFHIPIPRGRGFTERDDASSPGVVIINQAMARKFWPNGDPLNDRLLIGRAVRPEYNSDPARRVVGIVGDIRDEQLTEAPRPAMYVPMAQLPDSINALNLRLLPIAWIVRTDARKPVPSRTIQEELRRATGLPVANVRSMEQVASQSTAREQFDTFLMSIFGASALLLAAIGIYGLMAYSVQQRTHELGIRLALGASTGAVQRLILLKAVRLALAGIVIGLAGAFVSTRFISGALFGVKASDSFTFVAAPAVLGAVAIFASWLPALRATRVNPLTALRCD